MDEPNWIDREIARVAETQAAGDDHPEPHALSARFDRKTRRVLVELDNGCLFAFPAKMFKGLSRPPWKNCQTSSYWAAVMRCIGRA